MVRPYRGHWPDVHPTAFIDQSAQVIGRVSLGEASSVWMNVVVRGDVHTIAVGARSNIQDGTVVHVMRDTHPTSIGEDVTIGHGAIVHGCTVGDGVTVGMGAVVLSRATVGDEAIVAAGAVVGEDGVVEPGMLVMGVPAKPKRALTDDERVRSVENARRYVRNAARYREAGGSNGH